MLLEERNMDAIEDFKQFEKQAVEDRKSTDLRYWHDWDKNGRKPEHLEPLLRRFEPFLYGRMRYWKPPSMTPVEFRDGMLKNMVESMHRFEPNRGLALSTFVISRAPAIQRSANYAANVAYIPEKKKRLIGPVLSAKSLLTEQLGRSPEPHEIADHMQLHGHDISPQLVGVIQQAQAQKDVLGSTQDIDRVETATPRHVEIAGGQMLRQAIQFEFTGKNQPLALDVYDYTYGINGKPQVREPGEIARLTGRRVSDISKVQTRILAIAVKHL